jgi:hypothetical protein
MSDMQDIDLLLKVLNDAEIKIGYELIPQSGIAFTSDPPSVMKMPGLKSLVVIKQKDANGKVIHAALSPDLIVAHTPHFRLSGRPDQYSSSLSPPRNVT